MKDSKDSIDEVISVFESIGPFKNRLDHLRSQGMYIEYILLGSQLIEYMLSKLVLVYQHGINMSLLAVEGAVNSSLGLEIKIPIDEKREGIGSMVDKLKNTYYCHDDELIKLLDDLNVHRINSTHKVIRTYHGDVSKLDQELKAYTESFKMDPIMTIVLKIALVQEGINEDTQKRIQLAQSK